MSGPELHPDVAPLGFLLGSWLGEGAGYYSTIEDFTYGEEVRVSHVGKPFLAYTQRTWSLDDGRPLHSESGFWRLSGGTRVELVIAHPSGIVEVEEGELSGNGEDAIRQGRRAAHARHPRAPRRARLRPAHGCGGSTTATASPRPPHPHRHVVPGVNRFAAVPVGSTRRAGGRR